MGDNGKVVQWGVEPIRNECNQAAEYGWYLQGSTAIFTWSPWLATVHKSIALLSKIWIELPTIHWAETEMPLEEVVKSLAMQPTQKKQLKNLSGPGVKNYFETWNHRVYCQERTAYCKINSRSKQEQKRGINFFQASGHCVYRCYTTVLTSEFENTVVFLFESR